MLKPNDLARLRKIVRRKDIDSDELAPLAWRVCAEVERLQREVDALKAEKVAGEPAKG